MVNALSSGWLIAIAVAVIPALLGVIGNLAGREARTPQEIRNLTQLSESVSKVPVGSDAHDALGRLLANYVEHVTPKLVNTKKLNWTNVSLTIFLMALTLGVMYLLLNWISVSGAWNAVAIVVTVIVGLFLFLLNVASVMTWYNEPAPSKGKR